MTFILDFHYVTLTSSLTRPHYTTAKITEMGFHKKCVRSALKLSEGTWPDGHPWERNEEYPEPWKRPDYYVENRDPHEVCFAFALIHTGHAEQVSRTTCFLEYFEDIYDRSIS